jgi:hypothetical protein
MTVILESRRAVQDESYQRRPIPIRGPRYILSLENTVPPFLQAVDADRQRRHSDKSEQAAASLHLLGVAVEAGAFHVVHPSPGTGLGALALDPRAGEPGTTQWTFVVAAVLSEASTPVTHIAWVRIETNQIVSAALQGNFRVALFAVIGTLAITVAIAAGLAHVVFVAMVAKLARSVVTEAIFNAVDAIRVDAQAVGADRLSIATRPTRTARGSLWAFVAVAVAVANVVTAEGLIPLPVTVTTAFTIAVASLATTVAVPVFVPTSRDEQGTGTHEPDSSPVHGPMIPLDRGPFGQSTPRPSIIYSGA